MSRFRPTADFATIADAHQAILKLSRDVASLERSIQSLAKRLRQPADEDMTTPTADDIVRSIAIAAHFRRKGDVSEVTEIRDMAQAATAVLDDAYRHVAMMRAHMDAIESSAQLRDDYKHWLAEPGRANR